MKIRVVLFLLLVYRPVYGDTGPEAMLKQLLDAPWADSSSALRQDSTWRTEHYGEMNLKEAQGYVLRSFTQEEQNSRLRLFTYAEPSLHAVTEIVLMGYLRISVQSEEEGKSVQESILQSLKNSNFSIEAGANDSYRHFGLGHWKNVLSIEKGELSGLVYYAYDKYKKKRYVKTVLRHRRFDEYDHIRWSPGQWELIWWEPLKMPEKLVEELEARNIAQLITRAQWERIKEISRSSQRNYLPKEKWMNVPDLIAIYETIDQKVISEQDRPLFLLFQNYVVTYIFRFGLREKVDPHKLWLKRYGLEYYYSALGRSYTYDQNLLANLASNYGDSYWGHFAFVQMMGVGFDTPPRCRKGNEQWPKVLSEGRAFLEYYPESEFTHDVLFFLGKAEETLFSLGLDKNGEAVPWTKWTKYEQYTESSRLNALAYYEQALRTEKAEKYKLHLKVILPRLRTGISTGTSYYYCMYD